MGSFQWSEDENHCIGCGDNPYGLGLEFSNDEDWVVAKTSLCEHYQGFQDIAHGGIVALLIDEAAGWAIMLEDNEVAPSFDLNLKLAKPVPLNEEILIRGRVKDYRHSIYITEGQVLSSSGEVLASGTVKSKAIKG